MIEKGFVEAFVIKIVDNNKREVPKWEKHPQINFQTPYQNGNCFFLLSGISQTANGLYSLKERTKRPANFDFEQV